MSYTGNLLSWAVLSGTEWGATTTGTITTGIITTGTTLSWGIMIGSGVLKDVDDITHNTNEDDMTIAEIEAASPPPPVSDDKMDLVIFDEENYIEDYDNTYEPPHIPPQIEDEAFFQIKPEDILDEYTAQWGKVHVTTTNKGTFLRVKLD